MALYTRVGNENIPKDAVELSEEDATRFMQNIVDSWKKSEDVFFLRYGAGILSSVAALSGMYINSYYRHKLRLLGHGRMSSYLPIVALPALTSYLSHTSKVTQPILIGKFTCPVCMEVRAVSWQVLTGIAYSILLAPITCFMLAARYHTYNVPLLTVDPKNVFKLYKRFTQPKIGILGGLVGLHVAASIFITYQEQKSINTIKLELVKIEREYEEKIR